MDNQKIFICAYTYHTEVVFMPNMTLSIPEELHEFVKKHNEINWSEIARRAMTEQARKIELMEKLTENSKLTKDDIMKLDKEIKKALMKRYKE
jgi:hypothetical protein